MKRNQAEHVSGWLVKETRDKHGDWQWIAISSQSAQPIYDVVASVVALKQTGEKLISP
jgi:hypothetical protein